MVEESADKLCLIDIHESVSTCLWKTTLESLVCPMVVWRVRVACSNYFRVKAVHVRVSYTLCVSLPTYILIKHGCFFHDLRCV